VLSIFLIDIVYSSIDLPNYTTPQESAKWLNKARFGIIFDWSAKVNFETNDSSSYDNTVAKGLQKGSLYSMVKDEDGKPTGIVNWELWNPTEFDAKDWIDSVVDSGAKYFVYTLNDRYGFLNFDSPSTTLDVAATKWGKDTCVALAKAAKGKVAYMWRYQQHGGIDFILGSWIYFKSRWANNVKTYAQYRKINLYHIIGNIDLYGKVLGVYFAGNCGGVVPSEHPSREGEDVDYYDQENSTYLSGLLKKQPWLAITSEFYLKKSPKYNPTISLDRFSFKNYNRKPEIFDANHATIFSLESDLVGWAGSSVQETRTSNEAIKLLAIASGHNENLLLRVTPNNKGIIEQRQKDVLHNVGIWLKRYSNSIFETVNGPYVPNTWGVSTRKSNKIYLHILQNCNDGKYKFEELPNGIVSVRLLNNNQNIPYSNENGFFNITIPQNFAKDRSIPDRIVEITYAKGTNTVLFETRDKYKFTEPISTNAVVTANYTSRLRNRNSSPSVLVEELLDSKGKAAKNFYSKSFWSAPENEENVSNIYPVIVEVDLGQKKSFSQIAILEKNRRIKKFRVEYLDNNNRWQSIYNSKKSESLEFFDWKLDKPLLSQKVRVVIEESYGKAPQLRYIRLFE
jgi:alpha-L-fucosidase